MPNIICNYYGKCGGCTSQHLEDEDYYLSKISLLDDFKLLQPSCKINFISSKGDDNKRRRATLWVFKEKIGFVEQGTKFVIDINKCPNLTNNLNQVIALLKDHKTVLKNVKWIQITDYYSNIEIIFQSYKSIPKDFVKDIAILSDNPMIKRIFWLSQGVLEPIFIKSDILITFKDIKVSFPVASFMQASNFGENTITNLVMDYLQKISPSNLLDLFCGLGGYSITASQLYPSIQNIYAYDFNKPAIEALNNSKSNVNGFFRNLVSKPITTKEDQNIDTVIINPAREGAESQIKELLNFKHIKNIIMVYCSANSFTRDSKLLIDNGFKLYDNNINVVDQFLYTKHIEIVSMFKK